MNQEAAFFDAARQGDLEALRNLIAANPALLTCRNEMGQSAILLAQYHRQPEVVRLLEESGVPLTLHEAAAVGNLEAVQRSVAERGRLIDAHSPDGFTPLALACFFGKTEVVAYLVNQGANVSLAANNPMKVTPLHAAVAGRHHAIAQLLVENGADVNARQQQGWTPLHGAAQSGDETLIRLLLEHSAERTARSDNGRTALDLAMTQGHAKATELLTE